MDGDARSGRLAGQAIATICGKSEVTLRKWIRPDPSIKLAEGDAAPLQVVGALEIVLDLHVHDDGTGLLYLPDPSQLYPVGESGGKVAAGGIVAQIA